MSDNLKIRQHIKKFPSRVEVPLLLIPYNVSSSPPTHVTEKNSTKMQSNMPQIIRQSETTPVFSSHESYLGISIAEFDCNISFQLIFEPHSLHTHIHNGQN